MLRLSGDMLEELFSGLSPTKRFTVAEFTVCGLTDFDSISTTGV